MQKLSVTVITFNEEVNIRAALDSVHWADEVVVVDSFSTDRTAEICLEYTPHVHRRPWQGYVRQKNLAADLASNDWIFNLDADERVTPELRLELQGLLRHGPPCAGYYVARRNYFLGRWIRQAGWYPDYILRLYHKGKGRYGDREVHETVDVRGRVETLRHPLEHYTYRSVEEYLCRMDRYSTLAARELEKKGKPPRWYDCILRPFWTFWKMYGFRGGYREGKYGFVLSGLYAFYAFAKYAKYWEQSRSCRNESFDPAPIPLGRIQDSNTLPPPGKPRGERGRPPTK